MVRLSHKFDSYKGHQINRKLELFGYNKKAACKKVVFMLLWICQRNLHTIKKEIFSFGELNVYLNKFKRDTYSNANECHFFITIIIMIRSNKMIERYLRTLITKILFFIIIKSPLFMRFGRHSTTDISYENYTKYFNIIQWVWLNFDYLETHLQIDIINL